MPPELFEANPKRQEEDEVAFSLSELRVKNVFAHFAEHPEKAKTSSLFHLYPIPYMGRDQRIFVDHYPAGVRHLTQEEVEAIVDYCQWSSLAIVQYSPYHIPFNGSKEPLSPMQLVETEMVEDVVYPLAYTTLRNEVSRALKIDGAEYFADYALGLYIAVNMDRFATPNVDPIKFDRVERTGIGHGFMAALKANGDRLPVSLGAPRYSLLRGIVDCAAEEYYHLVCSIEALQMANAMEFAARNRKDFLACMSPEIEKVLIHNQRLYHPEQLEIDIMQRAERLTSYVRMIHRFDVETGQLLPDDIE